MTNVNDFFLTKLAKKEEERDPVIDPGEAATAGLAMAFSPFSKHVVPRVLRAGLSKFRAPTQVWGGDPVHGLKGIEEMKYPKEIAEALKKLIAQTGQGVNPERGYKQGVIGEALERKALQNQKILGGLFNITPMAKRPGTTTIKLPDVDKLVDMQKSVNSMLEKYKLPEKGVTLSFRGGPITSLIGSKYSPPGKEVVLPRVSKHLALHEIGHAAHLSGKFGLGGKVLRDTLHRGAMLSVPMAYIAGDEIKKMFPGEVDDKAVDFIQKNAPAIVTATYSAASIYPEIQANARAISHVYKTEGKQAAKELTKKLLPRFMSYAVPLIPAMIGIGMAKKWHREAKENREKLEKEAGIFSDIAKFMNRTRIHSGHAIKQIGPQAGELLELPTGKFVQRMYESGKSVLKSPEFAAGAALAGIPTALASYIRFNTPHGEAYAEKKRKYGVGKKFSYPGKGSPAAEIEYHSTRSQNSSMTPVVMGITAALSGGFLTKLFTDIGRVL